MSFSVEGLASELIQTLGIVLVSAEQGCFMQRSLWLLTVATPPSKAFTPLEFPLFSLPPHGARVSHIFSHRTVLTRKGDSDISRLEAAVLGSKGTRQVPGHGI